MHVSIETDKSRIEINDAFQSASPDQTHDHNVMLVRLAYQYICKKDLGVNVEFPG